MARAEQHAQWNIKRPHTLHDLPYLRPVAVSPPALVIAQRPIALHGRKTNGRLLILPGDIWLRWPVEEEQVDGSTECPPGIVFGLQDDLHAMRIPVIHAVGKPIVRGASSHLIASPARVELRLQERLESAVSSPIKVAGLEVKGVTSIEVAVDWIPYVSSVEGGCEVVVQAKTMNTLAQTIEVVIFGQRVDKLNKLVLVDEMGAFGGEKDVTGRLAGYGKPEGWIITPCYCEQLVRSKCGQKNTCNQI